MPARANSPAWFRERPRRRGHDLDGRAHGPVGSGRRRNGRSGRGRRRHGEVSLPEGDVVLSSARAVLRRRPAGAQVLVLVLLVGVLVVVRDLAGRGERGVLPRRGRHRAHVGRGVRRGDAGQGRRGAAECIAKCRRLTVTSAEPDVCQTFAFGGESKEAVKVKQN